MASRTLLFRLSLRHQSRHLPSLTTITITTTRNPTTTTTITKTTPLVHFSSTPSVSARKNAQDRHSIDTEATEYSKSGTDDESARQHDAAFDPSKTDPAEEKNVAGQGGGEGNPLEVSPANPEVSKQRGTEEGGAERSPKDEDNKQSGRGSPKKGGS